MRPTLPLTPRARGCYDAPAPVSTAVDDPRVRALALLKRHGYNATSFQTLERGFRYWFDGDEACVAYADTGSAWVVAGAPIAAAEQLAAVSARFQAAAALARRRVCYFAVEERMVAAKVGPALAIGAQPVWDPGAWADTLRSSASLREQIRRARCPAGARRPGRAARAR